MIKKSSIDSAVFLAGLTAILYTWSTAHYVGYLNILRLDSDMMERSFHQAIYNGLMISFFPVMIGLILFAFFLYIYSYIFLPYYMDWVRGSIGAKRRAIKFRRFWFGKRKRPAAELRVKAIFVKVAILALFGFLYILSLVYFESKGKLQAITLIEVHLEGKNKKTRMVNININNEKVTLRFLGCGTRNCAGIAESTNLIFYYPSSVGYSYLYYEQIVKKQ